jgi:hypothetical protein
MQKGESAAPHRKPNQGDDPAALDSRQADRTLGKCSASRDRGKSRDWRCGRARQLTHSGSRSGVQTHPALDDGRGLNFCAGILSTEKRSILVDPCGLKFENDDSSFESGCQMSGQTSCDIPGCDKIVKPI